MSQGWNPWKHTPCFFRIQPEDKNTAEDKQISHFDLCQEELGISWLSVIYSLIFSSFLLNSRKLENIKLYDTVAQGHFTVSIGFTLLYFKMAVIPLVLETKKADVGKLMSREPIGHESHVISARNYVHNFDLVPRIWSRLHDKDCLYILSSSKNSLSYSLNLPLSNTTQYA